MANVNIRVDDALKKDTENILSALGLSLSAATNLFYRQVVRYGGIPLDLRVSAPLNPTREDYLIIGRKILRDLQEESVKNGTDSMTMEEIDAMIAESRRERQAKKA